MKKLKIKKGYIAGLLTLFLAAAGLHVASAYATNVIDPGRTLYFDFICAEGRRIYGRTEWDGTAC